MRVIDLSLSFRKAVEESAFSPTGGEKQIPPFHCGMTTKIRAELN
jgi:hypothetical protein